MRFASRIGLCVAFALVLPTSADAEPPLSLSAVLLQYLGPGGGIVSVDVENPSGARMIIPSTRVVSVRAEVYDGSGTGVPGLSLGGSIDREGFPTTALAFRSGNITGHYASQRLDYPQGPVTFRVSVPALGLGPVEKTYYPIVLPVVGQPTAP